MHQRTAIALFSGGLDSILAIRLMQAQGIAVKAIHFTSPFFGEATTEQSAKYEARDAAAALGVPLKIVSLGTEYLEMLKKPLHGYGKAFNPCVDCHAYFLTKARDYMIECNADFVITGEVLGQRPMSQRRDTLRIVERDSGLNGLLLRPLSARYLPPTIPEQQGWVNRDLLPEIKGRSRKMQITLAEQYGIRNYPVPAGGCLLTEVSFVSKVKDLFSHTEHLNPKEFRLLKVGRHFRLDTLTKVIIGRNEIENAVLERIISPADASLRWVDGSSPLALVTGLLDDHLLAIAAKILLRYTKAELGRECLIEVHQGDTFRNLNIHHEFDARRIEEFRI